MSNFAWYYISHENTLNPISPARSCCGLTYPHSVPFFFYNPYRWMPILQLANFMKHFWFIWSSHKYIRFRLVRSLTTPTRMQIYFKTNSSKQHIRLFLLRLLQCQKMVLEIWDILNSCNYQSRQVKIRERVFVAGSLVWQKRMTKYLKRINSYRWTPNKSRGPVGLVLLSNKHRYSIKPAKDRTAAVT